MRRLHSLHGLIPKASVDAFRRSWLYQPFRFVRSMQQRAYYRDLQGKLSSVQAVYSQDALRAQVALRCEQRRQPSGQLGVAAFGARDWEDRGLWQSFSSLSDFTLFDKRKATRSDWPREAAARRTQLGSAFLAHVDDRERSGRPVHVAFIYGDGTEIGPATLQALAARGIWTVMMCLDDRQLLPGPARDSLCGWQLEVARAVDLYWTTWRSGADWLVSEGANAWYAPEAADPDIFSPPRPRRRDIDLLWIGASYGVRAAFIKRLQGRGFQVVARGFGWPEGPVSFEEMLELVARTRVVLGMGGVGQTDEVRCLKGRDFEMPMCGTVYLTGFNPELADHFRVGEEILCYTSEIDCAETLDWILRRPDLAERIRCAARQRCVAEHTWAQRVRDLLEILRLVPT